MEGKMKAVLKAKAEPGFVLEDVDIPSVGPDDLLVKVRRAAICGTDSHIYAWDAWSQSRIKPPLTVGHEFCGDVVEVGSSVKGYQVGDFVSAESHIPCGYCYQCHNDQQHICGNLEILGVDTDGCSQCRVATGRINRGAGSVWLPHRAVGRVGRWRYRRTGARDATQRSRLATGVATDNCCTSGCSTLAVARAFSGHAARICRRRGARRHAGHTRISLYAG